MQIAPITLPFHFKYDSNQSSLENQKGIAKGRNLGRFSTMIQFTGKAGYWVPFGISIAVAELSKRPYAKALNVYVPIEKDFLS